MATLTSQLRPVRNGRLHLLVFPREHGAWGMLLVPLATGAGVGWAAGAALPLVLLIVLSLCLFCLRTPLEAWLGISPLRPQTARETAWVQLSSGAYALLAAAALAALLWTTRAFDLLLLGVAVGAIFLVQALLKKLGRETRTGAQVIGAAGLTATAAAGYAVTAGRFDALAVALWAANALFAANQVCFVQARLHAARAGSLAEKTLRGRAFLSAQALTLIFLVLAWRFQALPVLALVAFAPILARGPAWFIRKPQPLVIRRLGWSELAHAVVFGTLLILGFHASFTALLRLP
jgi:YwiC-like protein